MKIFKFTVMYCYDSKSGRKGDTATFFALNDLAPCDIVHAWNKISMSYLLENVEEVSNDTPVHWHQGSSPRYGMIPTPDHPANSHYVSGE
jgi:hypothetical protein